MPNSHDAHMNSATGMAELSTAFVGMSNGISRPKSVQRKLEDAARGRLKKPLGSFPEVAEACVENGGSFFHIARPLTVMLAHLRRRCSNKLPSDMKTALMTAKCESDEAEVCAFRLALEVNCPSASDLRSFEKESIEAELALAKAREIVEDRLASMGEK